MATSLSKHQEGVRTFLAVEVHPDIRGMLVAIQRKFQPHAGLLKLVTEESMHITMRFLGGVAGSRLSDLDAAARHAAGRVKPFTLLLSHVGSFPDGPRAPRAIWVGLTQDAGYESLHHLFHELEDQLDDRGFGREKRNFAPHLTLARVRDGQSSAELRALSQTVRGLSDEHGGTTPFSIDHLTVFRSDLTPQGPKYTALLQAPFAR